MNMRRKDTFKYFISYFIVFIIPIVILSMNILNNFTNLLEKEIKQNSVDDMVKIKISLDTTFEEIEETITNLSKNRYIISNCINKKEPNNDIVKNLLNTTISSNNFISEIMLYTDNKDFIYSSVGKIPLKNIYDRDLIIKDMEYKDFQDILSQINNITYLNSTGLEYYNSVNNDGILVGYPLKINKNTYGFFLVLLNYQKLNKYIYSIGGSENNIYLILNKYNELIYATNDNILDNLGEYDIENRVFNIPCAANTTYKNNEFYITYRYSSTTELKYINILPTKPIYARYEETVHDYYFFLSIIMFIGIGLMYLFSITNYRPIKELVNFIHASDIPMPKNLNGTETVMFTLKYYKNNTKYLNDRIEQSSPAIRQFNLLSVLSGRLIDLSYSNSTIKELGIDLEHSSISVITIYLNNRSYLKDKNSKKVNFVEFVEQRIKEMNTEILVYGIEPLTTKNYIFIFNHNLSNDQIKLLLEQLLKLIEHQVNNKCTIGQGRAYKELGMVSKSYLEAVNSVEYRFTIGESAVISYSKLLSDLDSSFVYPSTEIQSFVFSILSCEFDKTEEILNSIIKILKKSYIPLYHAKTIVIDILSGIIRSFQKLDIKIPEELENQDINMLLDYRYLDEIESKIRSYIEIIKKEYVANERNDIIVIRTITYIEKNFCNPSFSIKAIADDLNLSQANLSYIFKSSTGKNVSSYVNNLRIEMAKNLLIETDMLVKDIVSKVGYYSASSFIKKFKCKVGMTPINYRKMNRSRRINE